MPGMPRVDLGGFMLVNSAVFGETQGLYGKRQPNLELSALSALKLRN